MNRRVRVESIAFGGKGVAHVDGKVLFIPYTVTGDEVWTVITEEKKRYSLGKIVQIIEPSPLRTHPPCPYFGLCGGCQWQHIDPSMHGEMKRTILIDILRRLGGLNRMLPVDLVPLSKPYNYRNRVQLKVREKIIGYYQEGSHTIIDTTHCPISHPLVNRILTILRDQRDFPASLEEIEINVSPQEEKGVLLFHTDSSDQHLIQFARQILLSQPILKGIAISRRRDWTYFGDPFLFFTVPLQHKKGELSFRISPGSFSQVNLEQNEKLIQTVLEFSNAMKTERVLDLYAGAGNFTLPLALHAKEVLGIEDNEMAIKDAQFNAQKNKIRNAYFMKGRVEEVLKNWMNEKPDQVILDPPRAGCKKIVDRIAGLKPKKIVYVSCDPTTFARDLRLLAERGYSVERLCLIDMFPQTYHMEVVGLLTRI